MMLASTLVPYVLSAPSFLVTSCLSDASVSFAIAALNFSSSAMATPGPPVESMTIAFSPFAPITAPSPPRPA